MSLNTNVIVIDLSSFNQKYVGGVSRYSKCITDNLINQSKNIEILLIPNKANRGFLQKIYGKNRILKSEIKDLNIVYRIVEKLNYNLLNSVHLFAFLQKMRYNHILKDLKERKCIIFCPTTYLNFCHNSAIQIVSLHDIQEKEFPRNFSRDQRIYRDLRVRYTISKAQKIQVSSDFVKTELRKHYKVESDKIIVIPEGVDLELFRNSPKISKTLDQISVFLPGKFLTHKNHIDFFKALNLMNTCSDIEIVIADYLENAPTEIIQAIKKLSKIQLKCVGELTDAQMISLYQSSDLTVVTSLYESSSLPILESLATGTMVLAADIPSLREMATFLPIKLYESQNLISLAENFDQLIALNFNREFNLIKYPLREFDWKNIANKYLDLFKVYS